MNHTILPHKIERRATTTTRIGNLCIGSAYPICIQSMANTNTNDVEGSVLQAERIAKAGGELIRFTAQGQREVESLEQIHRLFTAAPLVADIHFNANIADAAAKVVEKVRINPGNYIDPARKFVRVDYTEEEYATELERLRKRFCTLLAICKQHHTALRIGVNHGSLSDRIMSRYGDTPAGIVESCMEFLRIARQEDFQDIVVSVKASSTRTMVEAVRLLVQVMNSEGLHYPLHLGVTEAGEGEDGRLKSAIGIGALLADGIGDTIRVSLSEAPEAEIPVARALVEWFAPTNTLPREYYTQDDTLVYCSNEQTDYPSFALHAAADLGKPLIDTHLKKLEIRNPHFSEATLRKLALDILQGAGAIRYKTEYVSCPSCGRTLFELEKTIAEIKKATCHLQGLKIGIMGCIVNGPGEMADADYGYVGAGRGKVSLYKGKECVLKNIPQEQAVEALVELIKQNGDWKEQENQN